MRNMGGNMNDLVRQAGVMQNKIAKLQQELAERLVEASSGGGMVKVTATCKQELRSIAIDPKAMEGGDVEMLQDLVLTAVNEALRIGKATSEREISAITGGIRLPGIF
ncbi:MAG: YbaB/EbfC family nucleoid-associated protein [Desulfovibrionaceae bacterium]|nr:YbaB/EbfC family nucleoid-associated protein [Desulfovibrionaceae bacterium]